MCSGFSESATNTRFRSSIRAVFSRLNALAADPGPKFVVFHTLLPHDPYVFGAAGQPVTFGGRSDASLARATGRAFYVSQLRYLNRKLLESVDAILARSHMPPVIVLNSDEGFQANATPVGEAAMRDIRVKGLSAFYLPGRAAPAVPKPPNSVNALRFVFDRYLGTHYRMLPSASYAEGDLPYDFQPIQVK